MPTFHVRYLTSSGAVAEVSVDVARAQLVAQALGVREADVIALREATSSADRARARASRSPRKLVFPLRTFCQELSVLLDSGIPLLEALNTLREKESSTANAAVLDALAQELAQGRTLAQGLAQRPEVFGPLFVATVEASQRTGHIPEALRRHADYLAWLHGLRDRVVTASIYPAILVSASVLVMAFLAIFVVPRFAQIYADLGGELPWASRMLLASGQGVNDHPAVVVAIVCALAVGVAAAGRSPRLRQALFARLWRLPHIGPRVRLMQLAGLYRTLGMLLEAGVPMVPAMAACGGVVGNALGPALSRAAARVRQGARLSDSLEAEGLATPVSLRMVRVGEHSGQLGPMLERAATFYDEELARFAEWVGKVLSPALMLVMGVLIGGVVILMYLPIFQVAEQIQ